MEVKTRKKYTRSFKGITLKCDPTETLLIIRALRLLEEDESLTERQKWIVKLMSATLDES